MKNVHQVFGTGIQTHDLQNTSLLPYPLDQAFQKCLGTSKEVEETA